MERNAYLQTLREKANAYCSRKNALKEAALAAYNEKGEDSEEYARREEKYRQLGPCPVSEGEKAACWAEDTSMYRGSSEFEMEDSLWEKEVHDFISTLRRAGISSFVYTNKSSNALMNLCMFAEEGCRIGDVCTVRHEDPAHARANPERKGLRIHIGSPGKEDPA